MHSDVDLMETLTPSRQAWRRAIEDPSLRDLPYRIETNVYGQLVMSPVKRRHSYLQARIYDAIRDLSEQEGVRLFELAIDTPRGVKVPDVAWMSEERWTQQPDDAEVSMVAPEICVEVLSPSNTQAEIDEKRALYLACGAEEFWTCDEDGRIRFFDRNGEMPSSARVPVFPKRIA